MTTRELYIMDFLKEYKVARTSTLCHFFFYGKSSCYNILWKMSKSGMIQKQKLVDGYVNSENIYYLKKPPAQLRHALTLTDFYCKWDKTYGVEDFVAQKALGDVIPDAVMRYDGKFALVEIELSKKGFNYLKYEQWYASGKYKAYFDEMPEVIVYGNAKIPTSTKVKYTVVM